VLLEMSKLLAPGSLQVTTTNGEKKAAAKGEGKAAAAAK